MVRNGPENRMDKKQMPEQQIILGDSIEKLSALPAEFCDLIIADPPYNLGKDYGNNNDFKVSHITSQNIRGRGLECVRIFETERHNLCFSPDFALFLTSMIFSIGNVDCFLIVGLFGITLRALEKPVGFRRDTMIF